MPVLYKRAHPPPHIHTRAHAHAHTSRIVIMILWFMDLIHQSRAVHLIHTMHAARSLPNHIYQHLPTQYILVIDHVLQHMKPFQAFACFAGRLSSWAWSLTPTRGGRCCSGDFLLDSGCHLKVISFSPERLSSVQVDRWSSAQHLGI